MHYTYWLAQGPHFETKAEIDAIDTLGGHMVGMTMPREVKLAKELSLPYAAVCISSNWAAGREPGNASQDFGSSQCILTSQPKAGTGVGVHASPAHNVSIEGINLLRWNATLCKERALRNGWRMSHNMNGMS